MTSPTYSLVIPIYNEEETLSELYARLKKALDKFYEEFEIILVDDGSQDRSLEIIRELHIQDPKIKYLSFSRNFGHQIAITAGLNFVQGQVAIVMDADLQDPPELIPTMIEKWQEGYHLVYAQYSSRTNENWLKRFTSYTFYRIFRCLVTDVDIPVDTGDFSLMDRKIVDTINAMPERHLYLRGLRHWLGFSQTSVIFERSSRFAGRNKYTFSKSFALAVNAITSFSSVPLRLATYMGLLAVGIALLMTLLAVLLFLFKPHSILMGFPIGSIAIFFLGSVQMVCIGILGEYLGRIYEQVNGRPVYILKESAGVTKVC